MITLIKDDNNLLGTINSYIKLRKLRATDLLLSAIRLRQQIADMQKIFANAIGIGKTQAIVLAILIEHVYFKN
ncbi:hypothetical protein HBH48_122720 [Parastagonospora nodorum]|nr:hypothetical protein HBH48_122720 [Parastagonospora nodorum]